MGAGAFTGAAVLRVGMRTFAGWGDPGPSDRASRVDELPETPEVDRMINWFLFVPAAICILGCTAICFVPGLRQDVGLAATRFLDQGAYIHLVYTGAWTSSPGLYPLPSLMGPGLRGAASALLALLIALLSVFHRSVPRWLRWPSHIEGRCGSIRGLTDAAPRRLRDLADGRRIDPGRRAVPAAAIDA